MNVSRLLSAVLLSTLPLLPGQAAPDAAAERAPERFQKMLKLFPAADANGDGQLSLAEAAAYRQKVVGSWKQPKAGPALPVPTHANVPYGPHERNVLDLWLAPSDQPAPLVIFIHGGGFTAGDKSKASPAAIKTCLEGGASFMAINYRFREHAAIQDILRDAARAIQFVRCHAAEYHIDPKLVASFGASAGAGTSLWLAVHDDLADPASADPVLRQSSRIVAAGGMNPQASYDLTEWESFAGQADRGWLRTSDEDVQFYHFKSPQDFATPEGRKVLADCSMLRQISKDDPPVVLTNTNPDSEPSSRGAFIHHPRHVKAFQQRCMEIGVPCEAHLLGNGGEPRGDATGIIVDFLLQRLGAAPSKPVSPRP